MKKLTAGIFTALLGLVTVNAANAAIPSTNYVDTKIGAVETAYQAADRSIREDFATADTTTLNSAKGYTDKQVGTLTDLTTTAKGNTVAAINEVNAAIGTDTMGVIETGVDTSVTPTTLTEAVNALNTKIDHKTNGIATDAALGALQNTVNGHTTDISDLKTRMGTAENEIDTLQSEMDAVEVKAAANETAITTLTGTGEGSVAKAEADAKAYADGLGSKYDAAGAAAAAQEAAEAAAATYTDGQIDALAETYETKANVSTAVQEAKNYADNAANQAETSANSYADEKLALKVDIAQGAEKANHVVITNADGNVTTSATIEQAQVNGLSDALAAKLPVTAANNADGKYVLTATALDGTITYAWEDISRDVTE